MKNFAGPTIITAGFHQSESSLHLRFLYIGLIATTALFISSNARGSTTPLSVAALKCEYLADPTAIQTPVPRLSWTLSSPRRGEVSSAYQILVASSAELLGKDTGDLWDSGKVAAADEITADYAGTALTSRTQCFWKVRVWDGSGSVSAWSLPAAFSIGLLRPDDWQASWISDPILADPANLPRVPVHCYRSQMSRSADSNLTITLDLGQSRQIDAVRLNPARPDGLNPDIATFLYPLRFKVDVCEKPDFTGAIRVIDRTQSDIHPARPPWYPAALLHFTPVSARYVRLTVTRLAPCDGQLYGLALGHFEVLDGKTNVAVDAKVEAFDTMETDQWSKSFLTDPNAKISFAPLPGAISLDIPGVPASRTASRSPLLRREFDLASEIRRATLYVTARGFYEAHINGHRIGDAQLPPGFTAYDRRISYQSYDVTATLHKGSNAIAAMLGYGWYAGHMNLSELRYIYGYFPQFLSQLEIETVDGKHTTITSDDQWRSTLNGPIRFSDLLDGETCDLRMQMPGWDQPGFDDRAWGHAWTQPRDDTLLTAQRCQSVREIRTVKPVSVKQITPGVYVYDMGQEMAGWCRLKTDGPAGTHISVRHAEWQHPDGSLDTTNLWGVAQQDDYFLDGHGPQTLQPHFTYHGFRYVQVTGLSAPPTDDTLIGVVLHSDVADTGTFESSDDLFNRLMTAARWTQSNMMFDVPAGCAARGERLAWLGDIRPCVQTAIFNMDTAAFFEKYLTDLRDSQKPDGRFTDISPHAHLRETDRATGAAGWADCGVTLPWDLYVNFDDRRALAEHFDAARRWVDYVHDHNANLIWAKNRGEDWGDWLSAGQPVTPKDLGATAFFAHSADLVSRMAHVLGHQDLADEYQKLFIGIKQAFNEHYVSQDGVLTSDSEGAYALALQFDLLDEPIKAKAIAHLLAAIKRANGHPTTGFWSSDMLIQSLSTAGQNDAAAQLVGLTTQPSWGGMLAQGGTTFWEAFDAVTPGKPVNLSLNHWTHSAVGQWLWNNVAGLNPDPDHPGYRNVIIRPRPWATVCGCSSTFQSPRGEISIDWKQDSTGLKMNLTIPPSATATVCIPAKSNQGITEGSTSADQAAGIRFQKCENGFAVYSIRSGTYAFARPAEQAPSLPN